MNKMYIKKSFLIIIFLILLSFQLSKAENSAYSLIVDSNSNVVNPGDSIEINIFVVGNGRITDARIHVDIPYELNNYVSVYKPKVIFKENCYDYSIEEESWILNTARFNSFLEKEFFKPSCNCYNLTLSGCGFYNDITGQLTAPINIRLNISKNATSGDYFLKFNLYYYDGNDWHHDRETLNIHVTTYYERNEMKLWHIGFEVAIVTFIIAIVSMALSFHQIRDWIWENFSVVVVTFIVIILIFLIFVFLFGLCNTIH